MTVPAESMEDLTAVIKTFERPACLRRLLGSIRRYYPKLRVIVADDGFQPTLCEGVDYVRLPPDVGLSAGRNALLAQVRTPYLLLLDDDLKFTAATRIERLLTIARRSPGTIAGGTYLRSKRKFGLWVQRRPQPYHGVFQWEGDQLSLHRGWHAASEDHYPCDIVHNFFVARTEDLRQLGGWNPRLKLNDHVEFFVRVQQAGLHVAYCPDVVVEHWNASSPRRYSRFRNRNYLQLAFALHGIRTFVTPDCRKIDIPPLETLADPELPDTVTNHEQPSTRNQHAA